MLVDVVELNAHGRRLPREQWRAAWPVRGELVMNKPLSWHNLDPDHAPISASLYPPGQLEDLWKAKLVYLRRGSLVIMGTQRKEGRYEPQVWWCRIVKEDPPAQTAEPAAHRSSAHPSGQTRRRVPA